MHLARLRCVYCGSQRVELPISPKDSHPGVAACDADGFIRETCDECEDVLYRYFSSRPTEGSLAERLGGYARRMYGTLVIVSDPEVLAVFPDPSRIPEVSASMQESELLSEVIASIGKPVCIWTEPSKPAGCSAEYIVFEAGEGRLELFEVNDSTALRPWFDRDVAAAQDYTRDGDPRRAR